MSAELQRIERKLNILIKAIEKNDEEEDLINEKQAAEFLGITQRALQNLVWNGTVPTTCYKILVTGKRAYIKKRLIKEI